ncbi:MAG: IS30 family transposase [Saccharofermentanales bacterium]|jgi:IS30 family transposase
MPSVAQQEYLELLSDARLGRSYLPEEITFINETVKADLKRGLSPYAIWANHQNELPCSHRTIYRLIQDRALGDVSAFDLPYKIRYRPRKKRKEHKIDTECRKGRTYQDYLAFMADDPWPVVEMDSVIGTLGGRVILSLYFQESSMLLLFLRERNTAKSVIDLFEQLDKHLGRETFCKLFPVLLTDNGSEFSNPKAIEFDSKGQRRTRIYYCDPGTPNQKPGVEGAHKHLRRILPRGSSFDQLTQKDLNLVMGHVNGFPRKRLNDQTPLQSFSATFGRDTLECLNIPVLDPSQVTLRPSILIK